MMRLACFALFALALAGAADVPAPSAAVGRDPFALFDLPDDWEAAFWGEPGVKALLELEPKALAALVPAQAGLRHCRCPACAAPEADDPLAWSPARPEVVTCRRCGEAVPSDKFPAKVPPAPGQPPAIPVDTVEVRPHVFHKYPYHAVPAETQVYPDERLYLAAKRDYEAREWLAKAALYAAVRYRASKRQDRDLGRFASVVLIRFAQVYPDYATHLDQPGEPKVIQQADLPPPYRRGYQTAKWDWSGCLDVPLNLLIAYAILRDDPALDEAGRSLGEPRPRRIIERDLLRASAEFVRDQPEEDVEAALLAVRGLLAVGRLLDDAELIAEAAARLDRFAERCFYFDGYWRQGDPAAHRRVLGLLDGWIERLLPGEGRVAVVDLARKAGTVALADPRRVAVQRVAWPAPPSASMSSGPALLGGAGVARLHVGRDANALDLELRGLGNLATTRHHRLALRVAIGGRAALADLDELPPLADGWDRSTVSHNTVAVDGLNQRETIDQARTPAPGADVLFFAADPDFQVVTMQDRFAYPDSTTLYRRTLIAADGPDGPFAVDLFEVRGGLQHDWFAHAPVGTTARWSATPPWGRGPRSLLPTALTYLPDARAEDGRWFVQSYGAFDELMQAVVDRPTQAVLTGHDTSGVRLHLLTDGPQTLIAGTTPDPAAATDDRRGALIVRRSSPDGAALDTAFVTVIEPAGNPGGRTRIGRVAAPGAAVVLTFEGPGGAEHLVINRAPGRTQAVQLADGRTLTTDGLAARVAGRVLTLAGGSFAEVDGFRVEASRPTGPIVAAVRKAGPLSLGWFEARAALDDPAALAGRTLLIRHGDGTTRGWTIAHAQNLAADRCRLFVREEPGFRLDAADGSAEYYQFPRSKVPGPHEFRIGRLVRRQAGRAADQRIMRRSVDRARDVDTIPDVGR